MGIFPYFSAIAPIVAPRPNTASQLQRLHPDPTDLPAAASRYSPDSHTKKEGQLFQADPLAP